MDANICEFFRVFPQNLETLNRKNDYEVNKKPIICICEGIWITSNLFQVILFNLKELMSTLFQINNFYVFKINVSVLMGW